MENTEYKKDYSKLRPFDLEAAKRGETICRNDDDDESFKYIAGPDSSGYFVLELPHGEFRFRAERILRMAPLCWVEGKPVYKGDVLYNKESGNLRVVVKVEENTLCKNAIVCLDGKWNTQENLTWNKPKQKVKRKIWVNVYSDEEFSAYSSEETANCNAASDRITCVETEIEYKV
jgi:hypothetical protein